MAVEAVGATSPGTSTARAEFMRAQQKITEDLAAKAAEKVAAIDKAAVTRSDSVALDERQANSGRLGTAVDLRL
jgi:hypothetical protein